MTRWLGVDYGKKRIGLAISDPGESIASPASTLNAAGAAPEDAKLVLDWAARNEIDAIVVGLPLNMDGSEGSQAKLTSGFARRMREEGELPIELWDERLTSFQADEYMQQAGLSAARQKKLRDALAAQVMLQSFLDARRTP